MTTLNQGEQTQSLRCGFHSSAELNLSFQNIVSCAGYLIAPALPILSHGSSGGGGTYVRQERDQNYAFDALGP